jgi:hypothetical protein
MAPTLSPRDDVHARPTWALVSPDGRPNALANDVLGDASSASQWTRTLGFGYSVVDRIADAWHAL